MPTYEQTVTFRTKKKTDKPQELHIYENCGPFPFSLQKGGNSNDGITTKQFPRRWRGQLVRGSAMCIHRTAFCICFNKAHID